ncbi:hypothetical protein [Longispora fulva]|uniref:Uncharacterized protein n=1 Tax=Longispora fulva TaxID=619741 RepID=A0A8J7GSK0_9ACTN|nr:hypothetical protein [Longispora fulva]MBG6137488.1 hypothetical protein [Longispora fulva]
MTKATAYMLSGGTITGAFRKGWPLEDIYAAAGAVGLTEQRATVLTSGGVWNRTALGELLEIDFAAVADEVRQTAKRYKALPLTSTVDELIDYAVTDVVARLGKLHQLGYDMDQHQAEAIARRCVVIIAHSELAMFHHACDQYHYTADEVRYLLELMHNATTEEVKIMRAFFGGMDSAATGGGVSVERMDLDYGLGRLTDKQRHAVISRYAYGTEGASDSERKAADRGLVALARRMNGE